MGLGSNSRGMRHQAVVSYKSCLTNICRDDHYIPLASNFNSKLPPRNQSKYKLVNNKLDMGAVSYLPKLGHMQACTHTHIDTNIFVYEMFTCESHLIFSIED